jgi:hypothetical protein
MYNYFIGPQGELRIFAFDYMSKPAELRWKVSSAVLA